MSDTPDPLETDLAALQPRPVSPELRRRVAVRLGAPLARHRWVWGLALAGGLAAAGLTALFTPWPKSPAATVPPAVVPPRPPPWNRRAEPELLAYQQGLARSPEDLDALLDRHAVAGRNPAPNRARGPPPTSPPSSEKTDATRFPSRSPGGPDPLSPRPPRPPGGRGGQRGPEVLAGLRLLAPLDKDQEKLLERGTRCPSMCRAAQDAGQVPE